MEYFLGSLITFAIIFSFNVFIRKHPIKKMQPVQYTQSYIYSLVAPFLPTNYELEEPVETQATKHLSSISIRVVFLDNKAYWIKDNVFYVANAVNRDIDHETAIPVDTMTMDRVQLDRIKFVVEKLTEGSINDSWNAG